MLPVVHRMRRSADFGTAVRAGARAGRSTLVVHLVVPEPSTDPAASDQAPATVGFVVSRAVGGAVVRNRVRRRLRHLAAARVDALPRGSRLVVRALPPAAAASGARLGSDLDGSLRRVLQRTEVGA